MKDRKAFENHELWTLVEELKDDDRISDVPVDTRQYLRYLLEQLSKRKKTTNAYFVRRSSLDELRGELGNIRNQIPRNVSAIDGAIDECMGIIASEWPANNGRQIADIAEGVRDEFFTATEEKIEQARESADKVEELSRQFEEKKAEFDDEIESLKSSFEEAVKASKADLDGRRDELGARFESEVEERARKTDDDLVDVKQNYAAKLEEAKASAEQTLDEIENTANAVSGIAMTTDYAKYATDKEKAVRRYDGLAIFFAIVGIALVAFALTGLNADATSASVFKLAVSVASFTVSGFLFKRGTYNQREAKAARRTELTLREYRPFIANLEDEEKKAITSKIADRIFIKGEIGDKEEKTISNALLDRGMSEKQIASLAALLKAMTKDSSN